MRDQRRGASKGTIKQRKRRNERPRERRAGKEEMPGDSEMGKCDQMQSDYSINRHMKRSWTDTETEAEKTINEKNKEKSRIRIIK